jgi:exodeoxyribonuclease VII large subunit
MTDSLPAYLSLSQLNYLVQQVIEDSFQERSVWVLAETIDVKIYHDRGYCFLSLAEKTSGQLTARAEAVIWRNQIQCIARFEAATGIRFDKNLQLLFKVQVTFHPVYGLKLQVLDIDPNYTLGKMEADKQQVINRLLKEYPDFVWMQDEELMSLNKSLGLPLVIRKIAVLAAKDSDGWIDFLHEIKDNELGYAYHIVHYPVQVQGQLAAKSIANALAEIQHAAQKPDVVVLIRGGGSTADLLAFDELDCAIAVASLTVPVICGIGHQRNQSISDRLCFESVKTPTKAADFLIEHNRTFEESLIGLTEGIKLDAVKLLKRKREQLNERYNQVYLSARLCLNNKLHRLDKMEQFFRLSNPEILMKKGYVQVLKNNELIVSSLEAQAGDRLTLRFFDGEKQAKVER